MLRYLILIAIFKTIQLDCLCHFVARGDKLLKIIFEKALRRLQTDVILLIYLSINRL